MERYFSTDVLADIFLRLPPSSRRRARLVCRHWRDVVNKVTAEMQSRPKLLIWDTYNTVAYVSGDLSLSPSTGKVTELHVTAHHYWQLVGTCNGLLCLCDNHMLGEIGGALMLANPATGETLKIQPLGERSFCAVSQRKKWGFGIEKWSDGYSFAYHPITGRYKLVHIPCSYERGRFDAVHVLTVGETTWREVVPASRAMCKLDSGIVSVDGITYWVRVTKRGMAQIVSFDLMDERIISDNITVPVLRRDEYWLSEMRGRLGLVTSHNVWVLEEGRQWSHRYSFIQDVPRPHFVYGEYVLTSNWFAFSRHRLEIASSSSSGHCHVVQLDHEDTGRLVANKPCINYKTFTYVETTEPLNIYAAYR